MSLIAGNLISISTTVLSLPFSVVMLRLETSFALCCDTHPSDVASATRDEDDAEAEGLRPLLGWLRVSCVQLI